MEDVRARILFQNTYADPMLFTSVCLLHSLGIRKWHRELKPLNPALLNVFTNILFRCPYKVLTDQKLDAFFHSIAPPHMTSFAWIDQFAQQMHSKNVNASLLLSKERMKCAIITQLQHEESKGHTWSAWSHLTTGVARSTCRIIGEVEKMHTNFLLPDGGHASASFAMYEQTTGEIVPGHYQRANTRRQEDYLLERLQHLSRETSEIDEALLERVLQEIYGANSQRDLYQIDAIRNALQHRISAVSGPPGSGKTSCVIRGIVAYNEKKYRAEQISLRQKLAERNATDLIRYQMAKQVMARSYERRDIIDEEHADDADDADDDEEDDEDDDGDSSSFDAVLKRKYQRLRRQYTRAPTSTDVSLVKLTAPSGVAARRLSSACDGRPAHTCHAFVGQLKSDQSEDERKALGKTDRDFLPFKCWIVDESSMIDLDMFVSIMKAAEVEDVSLVFVGDANQLPPIGCGQVFQDLLDQRLLPSINLLNIYRQGSGSGIAKLSKEVMQYAFDKPFSLKDIADRQSGDLLTTIMSDTATVDEWNDTVLRVWSAFQKDAQPGTTTQILTPMNDGPGGRNGLNAALQAHINASTPHQFILQHEKRRFYVDDCVIHLRNDYSIDRRNGDMGRVVTREVAQRESETETFKAYKSADVDTKKLIFVKYAGGTIQAYARTSDAFNKRLRPYNLQVAPLKDLDLSYAITAHKSQGSEYHNVIMILPRQGPKGFLCDKLLNTMISRARNSLHIMAPESVWAKAVRTPYENRRTKLNHLSLFRKDHLQ